MAGARWCAAICCLGLVWALGPPAVAAAEDQLVEFQWTFAVLRPGSQDAELFPVVKDTPLTSGDLFKLYIEKASPCYVYWVYLSSRQKLRLLFPQRIDAYDDPPGINTPHYIPSGSQWFQLDEEVGQERFYVLASASRLLELENLFTRLAAAGDGRAKEDLSQKILAEIRRLRWENRKFKRTAERPALIMGQIRGEIEAQKNDWQKISALATVVRAENFYSKALTIDHR